MSGLLIPGSHRSNPVDADAAAQARRVDAGLRASHREHKQQQVTVIDERLAHLRDSGALRTMPMVHATIRSHSSDLMLPVRNNTAINVMPIQQRFAQLEDGSIADLVLFSESADLDHAVVFGMWNGRYIAEGTPALCITFRAFRLVEIILPDELYDRPELEPAYQGFQKVVDLIEQIALLAENEG